MSAFIPAGSRAFKRFVFTSPPLFPRILASPATRAGRALEDEQRHGGEAAVAQDGTPRRPEPGA
jgi:hypothetical protein